MLHTDENDTTGIVGQFQLLICLNGIGIDKFGIGIEVFQVGTWSILNRNISI